MIIWSPISNNLYLSAKESKKSYRGERWWKENVNVTLIIKETACIDTNAPNVCMWHTCHYPSSYLLHILACILLTNIVKHFWIIRETDREWENGEKQDNFHVFACDCVLPWSYDDEINWVWRRRRAGRRRRKRKRRVHDERVETSDQIRRWRDESCDISKRKDHWETNAHWVSNNGT